MNDALNEHLDKFVLAYLNNVLIYSRDKKEHVEHVKLVMKKLVEYSLLYKLEKCEFHKEEVKFLRYVIRTHGIKID